ncbi:hypothetical protein A8C56_14165 [Niabella ginsenosidivorans]|uniref:DUF4304 domain-containing protein n=1 Tax=Niabella ginsenosidivorans TaxID=1176587 RepID=A0A1A9I5J3_9BACT|nr:hypothetical protein [Niabella ginsenosidivorans]ANH81960.1 hypothetical protein A8C56_14165 [Niabella ginsenosidivorans]
MNKIISIQKVKTELFEGMCGAFKEHGFDFIKRKNAFQRTTTDCVQSFYFLIHKNEDGVFIEPRWSIKIPSILDIYHKVATKEKQYYEDTPVLENSLGELIEYFDNGNTTGSGKSMEYLVETEDDIQTLIKVIPKRFEKYVLSYFNKNSTVDQIDKLLNENPRKLSIHQWLYPLRACMGLIAAKIMNNPRINELVDIYEQELQDALPAYRIEFEKLKKGLN